MRLRNLCIGNAHKNDSLLRAMVKMNKEEIFEEYHEFFNYISLLAH